MSEVLGHGTYSFAQRMPNGELKACACRCDILNQSEKTYTIKVLQSNVNGHRYGDIMRVRKKSVAWDREEVDCSNKWWHD